MNIIYRRKFSIFIALVLAVSMLFFAGCKDEEEKKDWSTYDELIVEYIDVGQGDATFIKLPDGKTMLIDTGENTDAVKNKVSKTIEKYTDKIDYLVLTHMDNAHISNALNVIEEFSIGKAFVPKVLSTQNYKTYSNIYKTLKDKEIPIENSRAYLDLSSLDYTLLFLSPLSSGEKSSYTIFNSATLPTGAMLDNLSPIIYLEYKNTRFLFAGDNQVEEEEIVREYYQNSLYSISTGKTIKLEDIDFYKLANHGSSSSNGKEFLNLLKAKNVVISVSGANNEDCPATEVMANLYLANSEYTLYRTDRDKSITVCLNEFGKYIVTKEKN
jgi:competence protein ComEC